MSTPNTVDIFSRYMAMEFDEKEVIAVPTAFQSIFGKPGSETVFSPDANTVDIDIIRGNERTAALIPRGQISRPLGSLQKNMNVEKYTTFSRKYPLAEEEGDITGDQLNFRVAGENPYDMMSRTARMRKLGLKIHMESIRRIVRLFERLAAQSALTGKQDAILGTSNTDEQYDFRRNTNLTVTPANTWNSGSQDILGDIDGICDDLRQYGKVQPNAMFLGGDAMAAFIADTDVQANADNRRFELIQVSSNFPVPAEYSRYVASGWNARGLLRTPKGYNLWMFTNTDGYINEAGTFTQYMPTDEVLITSTMARADRYFGPPEQLPLIPQRIQLYQELFGVNPLAPPMPAKIMNAGAVIDPSMFYCDAYVSSDWKKVSVRTQAAPIFATTHTDAFGLLQNLIT
jgi:hypothetical protein